MKGGRGYHLGPCSTVKQCKWVWLEAVMMKECESEKENVLSAYHLAILKLLHFQLCISVPETVNSNASRCCEDQPVFNRDFVLTIMDPWGVKHKLMYWSRKMESLSICGHGWGTRGEPRARDSTASSNDHNGESSAETGRKPSQKVYSRCVKSRWGGRTPLTDSRFIWG